jgi:hypothetical protein
VALEDWKRYRDIVPVPVIESDDRIAARLITSSQALNALLEANDRPSFSLQPTERIFKKFNRSAGDQFRPTIPLNLVEHQDDRPAGEQCATNRKKSKTPNSIKQAIL